MKKTILIITLLILSLVFTRESHAKTRQAVYNYGKKYTSSLTYVFKNNDSITKFRKPIIVKKRKNNYISNGLKRLAMIIGGSKNASAIKLNKKNNFIKKYTAYGFNFNSYKISPFVAGRLNYIKNIIKENHYKALSITGYTDHFGTKKYNDELALERAKSAEKYLGLKNIKVYGYGKCRYISKRNFKNRRIVIRGKK
jgi:outer membrane protein OmpA-like peptidoglycan-associated protein